MKVKKIAAFILALTLIVGVLALPASATTHSNCPTCGGTVSFRSWVDAGWESIGGIPCIFGYSHTDGHMRRNADFYCPKCKKAVRMYVYGAACPTVGGVQSIKAEGEVA